MKKQILLSFAALGLVACQSISNGNTNLVGVYQGKLPCADCQFISSRVTLYKNGEFAKTDVYVKNAESEGDKFTENGTYDKKGNIVTLYGATEDAGKYQVTTSGLVLLDANGKAAKGALANQYILKKLAQ